MKVRSMKSEVWPILATTLALLVVSLHGQQPQTPARPGGDEQGFRFKSGVELINVTATVSDASGRFVSGCVRKTSWCTKTTSRSASRISTRSACR